MLEEQRKDPKSAEETRPMRSRYDDFVEGVAAEEITRAQGADPRKIARISRVKDPETGRSSVHLQGSQKAVDDVAEGLRGEYGLEKWYVGRPTDPEREAEVVGLALEELAESTPKHVLPRLGAGAERAREKLGLPRFEPLSQALEAGDRLVDEAAKVLSRGPFRFGQEKFEEREV